jgi:hypothetical protein
MVNWPQDGDIAFGIIQLTHESGANLVRTRKCADREEEILRAFRAEREILLQTVA